MKPKADVEGQTLLVRGSYRKGLCPVDWDCPGVAGVTGAGAVSAWVCLCVSVCASCARVCASLCTVCPSPRPLPGVSPGLSLAPPRVSGSTPTARAGSPLLGSDGLHQVRPVHTAGKPASVASWPGLVGHQMGTVTESLAVPGGGRPVPHQPHQVMGR